MALKKVPSQYEDFRTGYSAGRKHLSFFADHQWWREQQRMRRLGGRLLITLVLLAVATSTAWTTAHARSSGGARWVRSSHVSASVVIGSRPGMRPASGEPDGGAAKIPPLILGRSGIVDQEPVDDPSSGSGNWFSRIGAIWMARYLGVR